MPGFRTTGLHATIVLSLLYVELHANPWARSEACGAREAHDAAQVRAAVVFDVDALTNLKGTHFQARFACAVGASWAFVFLFRYATKLENGHAVVQNGLFWAAYHAHSAIPGYHRPYRICRGRCQQRARRG